MNSPTFIASSLTNNDVVSCEITSSLSCASPTTATSAGITMTVVPEPVVTINTVVPTNPLCTGDTLQLSASANSFGFPGTGHWAGPGVQGSNFIASVAGSGTHTITYGFALINSPICTGSQSIQVTVENVPKPTITANGMLLTCNQSGFNYQWMKNGSAIAGATSQAYTVTGNGNYSVEISLTHCTDESDPVSIQNFGAEEIKAAVGFKLFPNPTTDRSYFELNNPGGSTVTYELIAFNGAVVHRNEIAAEGIIRETVDLRNLATGIYNLRITVGDYTFVERVGKQ